MCSEAVMYLLQPSDDIYCNNGIISGKYCFVVQRSGVRWRNYNLKLDMVCESVENELV